MGIGFSQNKFKKKNETANLFEIAKCKNILAKKLTPFFLKFSVDIIVFYTTYINSLFSILKLIYVGENTNIKVVKKKFFKMYASPIKLYLKKNEIRLLFLFQGSSYQYAIGDILFHHLILLLFLFLCNSCEQDCFIDNDTASYKRHIKWKIS